MENNLHNEKLDLEIQLLKAQLEKLTDKEKTPKKGKINWTLLIPIMTAIIGGLVTIFVSLNNTANSIDEKKLERETTIIEDVLEAPTAHESKELLKFYIEIGLLENMDKIEKKLEDPNYDLPIRPQKLSQKIINLNRGILLIDNIERHYRGIEGFSNADDIWIELRKYPTYRNNVASLVIDQTWDEKNIELIKEVKEYNPKLIIMHLSSFFHQQGNDWTQEQIIFRQKLKPFLIEILSSSDSTDIILYSRKSLSSNESPLKEILDLNENRIKYIQMRNDFADAESISILRTEIDEKIN